MEEEREERGEKREGGPKGVEGRGEGTGEVEEGRESPLFSRLPVAVSPRLMPCE